jgi:hypothetical protein
MGSGKSSKAARSRAQSKDKAGEYYELGKDAVSSDDLEMAPLSNQSTYPDDAELTLFNTSENGLSSQGEPTAHISPRSAQNPPNDKPQQTTGSRKLRSGAERSPVVAIHTSPTSARSMLWLKRATWRG